MFVFIIFFIDIIIPVFSSSQTACDVTCVQYVIQFLHSLEKKTFSIKTFSVSHNY